MESVFQIYDKIKVSVEVGQFGKFVRLFRTSASGYDSWLVLSPKLWLVAFTKLQEIEREVSAYKDYTEGLTKTKWIQVKLMKTPKRGTATAICFHETKEKDGKTYNTYINFNNSEYIKLRDEVGHRITQLLNNSAELYGEETPRVKWHLSREALPEGVKPSYSLMKIPPPKEMVLIVIGYLMEKQIQRQQLQSCPGCLANHPSQSEHMEHGYGCLTPWSEAVVEHAREARREINTAAALTKINQTLGWSLADPGTDYDDIFAATLDHEDCKHKFCENKDKCATEIISNLCDYLKVGGPIPGTVQSRQ